MKMALLAFVGFFFPDAATVEFSLRGFHYLRVVLTVSFFSPLVTPSLSKRSSLKSEARLRVLWYQGQGSAGRSDTGGWTPGLRAGDREECGHIQVGRGEPGAIRAGGMCERSCRDDRVPLGDV